MMSLRRSVMSFLRSRGTIVWYYTRPKEKKKGSGQAWLLLAGVATTLSSAAVYILGRPEDKIEGMGGNEPDKYEDENVVKAHLLRARDRIREIKSTFSEPTSLKLLPDLLPPQYQRPYTLVLELNDLLIRTEYDREVGWKYQKRPGVDALLISLFDHYEIVVFTSEAGMTGNSVISALDPNQLIMYRLFRDSTKYINGCHVKDLSALNRPLNRVIVVDTSKDAVKFQPENAIILDKWTGDISDKTLWDLSRFLQTIAVNNMDDIRPILDYYKHEGGESKILETFKAYQAQLQAQEEDWNRQMEVQQQRHAKLGGISPFSFKIHSHRTVNQMPDSNQQTQSLRTSESLSSQQQSWTDWIGTWVGWK